MIKDRLEYASNYYGISNNLKKAFEWLMSQDLVKINTGKYYIDDKDMFVNIQEYETKTDAMYETHKKYIDIQYMIKGEELIGVVDKNKCKHAIPYSAEDDIEFMNYNENEVYQVLTTGEFVVLFPNDAHKPSINSGEKSFVKKAIVKVPVN